MPGAAQGLIEAMLAVCGQHGLDQGWVSPLVN